MITRKPPQASPSLSQLQKLFCQSPDSICTLDAAGRITAINEAGAALMGYSPCELSGRGWQRLIFEEDQPALKKAVACLIRERRLTSINNRILHRNGTMIALSWSVTWDPDDRSFYCIGRPVASGEKGEGKKVVATNGQGQPKIKRILEQLPEGFFTLDSFQSVTYWNRQAEKITGFGKRDITGKNLWTVYPELVNTPIYTNFQRALTEHTPVQFESIWKDSNTWYELTANPFEGGLWVYFRDITERKNAEERLRRLSSIAQVTVNAVILTNLDHRITWVNDAFTRMSGYSYEEALGKTPGELLDCPETDPETLALVREKTLRNEPFQLDLLNRTKNDGRVWWRVFFQPIYDQEGAAIEHFCIATDITEGKVAEMKLKDRENLLRQIAELSPDAINIYDLHTKTPFYVNEVFPGWLGYHSRELLDLGAEGRLALLHEEDRDALTSFTASLAGTKESEVKRVDYRLHTKDGNQLWITNRAKIFRRDKNGDATHVLSILQDSTEQKKTEEELKVLSLLARETTTGVSLVELDSSVSWINEAYTAITGYNSDDAKGTRNSVLLSGPDTDQNTVKKIVQAFHAGQSWKEEMLAYRKDRSKIWLEVGGQPMFDKKGRVQRYFVLITDISEHKRMEQERKDQQKRINAAAIAAQEKERAQVGLELHDNVNQVLTSVKLYQELCLAGVGDQKELIRKSATLLQASINEIRSLSKRLSAPTLGSIRLKDSVQDLIDTVAATDKFFVQLDTSVIEELEVDQDLHLALYRILQEHLTNILKHAEASLVTIKFDLEQGHLLLCVCDNGKGFDPQQKSGGIGITNMKARAENMQGTLAIDSAPGKGCELHIRIPLPELTF